MTGRFVDVATTSERVIVDSHLETCPACQAELAGLAGLPALLGRVPLADAERITDAERMGDDGYWAPTMVEPSPELLSGLLGRVAYLAERISAP